MSGPWVCDGCMAAVSLTQIGDMVDGEHVLCVACCERGAAGL